jgi:hypothetical protein
MHSTSCAEMPHRPSMRVTASLDSRHSRDLAVSRHTSSIEWLQPDIRQTFPRLLPCQLSFPNHRVWGRLRQMGPQPYRPHKHHFSPASLRFAMFLGSTCDEFGSRALCLIFSSSPLQVPPTPPFYSRILYLQMPRGSHLSITVLCGHQETSTTSIRSTPPFSVGDHMQRHGSQPDAPRCDTSTPVLLRSRIIPLTVWYGSAKEAPPLVLQIEVGATLREHKK